MLIIYDAVDMAPNQNLNCKTIPQPDPAMATRKMATAERVARQREQQGRLVGWCLLLRKNPANHLVDLFVVFFFLWYGRSRSEARSLHEKKQLK